MACHEGCQHFLPLLVYTQQIVLLSTDCAFVTNTPTLEWVTLVLHNFHHFLSIQLISLHVCAANLPWASTLHLFVSWIPPYHPLHPLPKCASVQGLFNFLISRQLRESMGFWPPYVNQSYNLPVRATLCLRVSILQERHGHYANSNWRTQVVFICKTLTWCTRVTCKSIQQSCQHFNHWCLLWVLTIKMTELQNFLYSTVVC